MLKVLDFILRYLIIVWGSLFVMAGILVWSSDAEQIIFFLICGIAYLFHLAIPKNNSPYGTTDRRSESPYQGDQDA